MRFRGPTCITVPDIVPIGQLLLWRYGYFRFKMAPLAIWDFSKFENLTISPVQGANIRHRAKFCADRSNLCGVMAVFRFFKMAAVCHLEFLKVWHFNY